MEIGEQRKAPNLSSQGEGILASSSSSPSSTSELVNRLMENQIATDAQLRVVEIDMTTLYEKMSSGVRTRFKQAEARCKFVQRATLSNLCIGLQTPLDDFERQVTARFTKTDARDLTQMREDLTYYDQRYALSQRAI
ncbi:hypothetical protein FXO37_16049 [Capsicum annuum]|nr:hypothetical protein FXO37_16049 [Capsicum annuum]